mmetsp:Transcript_4187/g.11937  ORF Transcript_4187/g.11937 Transcript_4187/m.11937 type:complete len:203 (+) Transcript_4187:1562-2170(+)
MNSICRWQSAASLDWTGLHGSIEAVGAIISRSFLNLLRSSFSRFRNRLISNVLSRSMFALILRARAGSTLSNLRNVSSSKSVIMLICRRMRRILASVLRLRSFSWRTSCFFVSFSCSLAIIFASISCLIAEGEGGGKKPPISTPHPCIFRGGTGSSSACRSYHISDKGVSSTNVSPGSGATDSSDSSSESSSSEEEGIASGM